MLNVGSHKGPSGPLPDVETPASRRISAAIGGLSGLVAQPVEELAKLRSERKRLEKKIRNAQEMLARVRRETSEILAERSMSVADKGVAIEEDLMGTEQSYERLLQSLLDMRTAFEQQMRALDEQIVQANVEHLRQTFDQKKNMLDECLSGIDQKVLDCIVYIEEYKRTHADLVTLRNKLHQLNSDSLEVPEPVPTHDAQGVISLRIEHLRAQGKF